jgi:hypothetical protein
MITKLSRRHYFMDKSYTLDRFCCVVFFLCFLEPSQIKSVKVAKDIGLVGFILLSLVS